MVNYSLWNNDWIEVLGANRIVDTVMKISLVVSLCRSTSLQTKRESRTCRKVLMHSIGSNVVIGAGILFDTYSLSLSLFLYCIIFIVIAIISPSCDYERRCSMAHFFVILSTSRYPAYCTIAPAKYEKGEFQSKKKNRLLPNGIMVLLYVMCVLI